MTHPANTFAIRAVTASDQPFVARTWWISMRGGPYRNRDRGTRNRLNAQIDRVLDDKSTRALVCVRPGDRDYILGWIVYADAPRVRVVHYLYVRREERGKGIARALIERAWPDTASSKFVLTLKGPDTNSLMARRRDAVYIPLDEWFR